MSDLSVLQAGPWHFEEMTRSGRAIYRRLRSASYGDGRDILDVVDLSVADARQHLATVAVDESQRAKILALPDSDIQNMQAIGRQWAQQERHLRHFAAGSGQKSGYLISARVYLNLSRLRSAIQRSFGVEPSSNSMSDSTYFTIGGKKVRLSDHALPEIFKEERGVADVEIDATSDDVNSVIVRISRSTGVAPNRGTFDLGDPDIEVDGVLRPTTTSEGRPIHPTVEGIRNFWRWFGDSRAVDAEGRPLVVYHGTAAGDPIEKFAGNVYAGWFSPDTEKANAYTSAPFDDSGDDGAVYPTYLSIKNPMDLSAIDASDDFNAKALADAMGVSEQEVQDLFDERAEGDAYWTLIDTPDFREWAEGLGHDGLTIKENGAVTWAALRPGQTKSATGNRGTFDPADPDIRDMGDRDIRSDMYLPLSPTQIKSATGNRGAFDPADPGITMSRRRRVARRLGFDFEEAALEPCRARCDPEHDAEEAQVMPQASVAP